MLDIAHTEEQRKAAKTVISLARRGIERTLRRLSEAEQNHECWYKNRTLEHFENRLKEAKEYGWIEADVISDRKDRLKEFKESLDEISQLQAECDREEKSISINEEHFKL